MARIPARTRCVIFASLAFHIGLLSVCIRHLCLVSGFQDERYNDHIRLVGSPEFRARTRCALDLVQRTRHAKMVDLYVSVVQQEARSGMRADEAEPTLDVGERTWRAGPTWYGSTIVHDAAHSKLYHQAKQRLANDVPTGAWTGKEAERVCLRAQVECLNDLGADPSLIQWAEAQIESPEYQGNSGNLWDYLERNW